MCRSHSRRILQLREPQAILGLSSTSCLLLENDLYFPVFLVIMDFILNGLLLNVNIFWQAVNLVRFGLLILSDTMCGGSNLNSVAENLTKSVFGSLIHIHGLSVHGLLLELLGFFGFYSTILC